MSRPILVINPNSNADVTQGISDALEGFRFTEGPQIECLTLAEGPFGIESQLHSDSVILPLVKLVQSRPDAGGIVIACYSDPGIDAVRSVATCPVFGIQESGTLMAMARGDRFGVIALSDRSIARHMRYLRRMQVIDRLAGERAADLTVAESASDGDTFETLVAAGRLLRDQDDADAIILGCAGMARHRAALEAELGVPVIDPTQAAVAMALGAIRI
ncbi:MAG: aspartate/glutamate racemase family protein [Pseudomonadota bacterium]